MFQKMSHIKVSIPGGLIPSFSRGDNFRGAHRKVMLYRTTFVLRCTSLPTHFIDFGMKLKGDLSSRIRTDARSDRVKIPCNV